LSKSRSTADFCRPVRINRSPQSGSRTNDRSPEVSSTAFPAQPPDLQPVPLMDMDFVVVGQLVRHCMPHIRFCTSARSLLHASLRPRLATTPLRFAITSPPSGCEKGFNFELSNMLGTTTKSPATRSPAVQIRRGLQGNSGEVVHSPICSICGNALLDLGVKPASVEVKRSTAFPIGSEQSRIPATRGFHMKALAMPLYVFPHCPTAILARY